VGLEERPDFGIRMEQIRTKTKDVFGIHLACVDDPRLHRCHHCIDFLMQRYLIVSLHQREAGPLDCREGATAPMSGSLLILARANEVIKWVSHVCYGSKADNRG